MSEQWRPVVGWEGSHEVSDHGRVRSLDRVVSRSNGTSYSLKGRVMALHTKRGGHLGVRLSVNGKAETHQVHRLVLEAFVSPRPEGKECCHNDGNPANNHLSNLRWDTHLENMRDRDRHRVHHELRKTHCPQGHEYTEDNIYRQPARPNARFCKTCKKESDMRRHERGNNNSKKTECPQGHPYDEENTRHYRGRRYCRACSRKA